MDDTRHLQATWVPVGAALFVGGYVVSLTWLFTALAAPPGRHLSELSWPLIVPGVFSIAGLYVFAAVLSPAKWLRFPGKSKAQHRAEQEEIAPFFLALFVHTGRYEEIVGNEGSVREWQAAAVGFVRAAWGPHAAALVGLIKSMTADDPHEFAHRVNEELKGLAEQSLIMRVKDNFEWGPETSWMQYINRMEEVLAASDSDGDVESTN